MLKNAFSNKFGFIKKEFQYCFEKSGIKYIYISELGVESEKEKRQGNEMKLTLISDYLLLENLQLKKCLMNINLVCHQKNYTSIGY